MGDDKYLPTFLARKVIGYVPGDRTSDGRELNQLNRDSTDYQWNIDCINVSYLGFGMSIVPFVGKQIGEIPLDVRSDGCGHKKFLFSKCCFALGDYKRAIEVIELRRGVLHKSDYDAIWQAAERYIAAYHEARSELELHTAEHGC